MLFFLSLLTPLFAPVRGVSIPRAQSVQLAVKPSCGSLGGGLAVDTNDGLGALNTYKTIVAFGDSYTAGGVTDGRALQPAVLVPPNPRAGGRASNGPIWAEYLAAKAGAELKDYAVEGAVVDRFRWPSGAAPPQDLATQVNTFIAQRTKYDPATTLYTIFFGIQDFEFANATQTSLSTAAQNTIVAMWRLSSSPTFARNFLVLDNYGRGQESQIGEDYKQELFQALLSLRYGQNLNIGFVDFANIWNGVFSDTPGHKAFGYTSTGACTDGNSTIGACADADHSFYWLPGMPSTATHSIMADYVEAVLATCV